MNVCINQIDTQVVDSATIADILPLMQLSSTAGIAIAVNESIVPRAQWDSYTLQANDKLILIRATQGG